MRSIVVTLLALLFVARAQGQNIDVSTLPSRDSVQLTIYNSEDLTLVRETRHVTVRKGRNELQFSWANTLIDATSVLLRFPRTAGMPSDQTLELIDTRMPSDRPQALYWLVESSFDGEALVEISYFTSGITWSAEYVGTLDASETSMTFDGFVTITNSSGEEYENAQVRMVVGTINLVEKIRELAERWNRQDPRATALPPASAAPAKPGKPADAAFRRGALRDSLERAEPKQIVKEGLSEYFLFSVPGEETIRNGWSKRLRLFAPNAGAKVPLRCEYRYRPMEYGEALSRVLLVRNDTASSLGESPLPDGSVRLFKIRSDEGRDGLSAVGFVSTKYVPIGQEFEFNLGSDPQVILERLAVRRWRDDVWFQSKDPKRLVSPTKGDRIDPTYVVSGWNESEERIERIRNYRGEAIDVAWRFPLDGDVVFRSGLDVSLFDFRTPEFKTTVPAGAVTEQRYSVVRRVGTNQKQANVTLENMK